jgi:hypothetical protein
LAEGTCPRSSVPVATAPRVRYVERYPYWYAAGMTTTSMKIQTEVRDHLTTVAARDFRGATLSDTVAELLAEHERSQLRRHILAAYGRIRENPEEWDAYVAELNEWDAVSADSAERPE